MYKSEELDYSDEGKRNLSEEDRKELLKKFKEEYLAHKDEISVPLEEAARCFAEAQKFLNKAAELSEKYSIPLNGPHGEDYIPKSLLEGEFNQLYLEELDDIMDTRLFAPYEDSLYSGWFNSSASC